MAGVLLFRGESAAACSTRRFRHAIIHLGCQKHPFAVSARRNCPFARINVSQQGGSAPKLTYTRVWPCYRAKHGSTLNLWCIRHPKGLAETDESLLPPFFIHHGCYCTAESNVVVKDKVPVEPSCATRPIQIVGP